MTIVVEASDELRVSEGCRRDLLRIVREAIANAARHGEAGRVVISVARSSSGLELSVIDDGRGLSDRVGRVAAEGFGIASMRDRAAVLGGQLTIHRPAGGGTELVVRIP
jgi:signal transduction histidine kinase